MNTAIIKKEDLENIFDNQLYMYDLSMKDLKILNTTNIVETTITIVVTA